MKIVNVISEVKKILGIKIQNTETSETRSLIVKKNVILSTFTKLVTVVANFVLLPLSINYLTSLQFGIYATISSVALWIDMFDLGLGQGLRNKLTGAYVKKDFNLAKEYISTTYFVVSLLALAMFGLFVPIFYYTDWNSVLNAKEIDSNVLDKTVFVVFFFFFLRFISNIITKILFAMQFSAWVSIIQMLQKIVLLVVVILLMNYSDSSIFYYAFAQSIVLFSVPLIVGFYFFNTKFKIIAPSIYSIRLKHTKSLLGLGVKFFIIQISLLVMVSSNKFMISYFVDPAQVTVYEVAFNYFNSLTIVFALLTTPFWSAFTEAWNLKQIDWIKKSIKKLVIAFLFILVISIIMLVVSPFIYEKWIGNSVNIHLMTSLLICCIILLNLWTQIFDFFLNGISKIYVQMLATLIAAIINIPISYYLSVVLEYGINGVIMGTVISFLIMAVISPLQTYMILAGKAKGILNK